MCARSVSRVLIDNMPDKTALVSFVAQTCAIPLCMNKSAYRIFILLSAKLLICIMTAMKTAQTNCSILSLLPSKLSAALALHSIAGYQLLVDMGQIYPSEWLGRLWRTKGSEFESVVYILWLIFPVPHLNLTLNYHLEIERHLLSQIFQPETLPKHPQRLINSSRLGATQLHLVPLVSVPL